MGTDVWINGNLKIPASKVLEAGKLLLEAITDRDKSAPDSLFAELAEKIKTSKGVFGLLEERMESLEVSLEDDGSLEFGLMDCTRHEDYDQWVFEALAPVFDNGEFYMSADDYNWMWEVKAGVFREVSAETVYGHDADAVPTIEKITALIYPEDLEGKPVTAIQEPCRERNIDILFKIENLLREAGYGPQAGMNGLERLSEV